MKRIGIIATFIVAAGLFATFVGLPHRYHHQSYRLVGETPGLNQLEIHVRFNPGALRYLLGAPVKTGGPYRLSIGAYGNRCCDRQLVLHSAVLVESDGRRHALLDEEYVSDFSAREIWRTNIYPIQKIDLPFQEGTELTIEFDMSLITASGEVRRTLERRFLAEQFAGFRFFPLTALLYS